MCPQASGILLFFILLYISQSLVLLLLVVSILNVLILKFKLNNVLLMCQTFGTFQYFLNLFGLLVKNLQQNCTIFNIPCKFVSLPSFQTGTRCQRIAGN